MRRLLRTIGLTSRHEARLLVRDPVVLLMLLCAPVVIITVAGYSLGALYGDGGRVSTVAVADEDGGAAAARIVRALARTPSLRLEAVAGRDAARARIGRSGYAPIAIVIAPGTSAALTAGRDVALELYLDPARRLEVNALELRLAGLCRAAAAGARRRAARGLRRAAVTLDRRLARAARTLERDEVRLRAEIVRADAEARATLRLRLGGRLRALESAARTRETVARAALARELAGREAALVTVVTRARELDASREALATWLASLRAAAGSGASRIPPPPEFPAPLPEAALAALSRPLVLPDAPPAPARMDVATLLPPAPALPRLDASRARAALAGLREEAALTLPGALTLTERPAADGAPTAVNAFDQYVPGFGVTFLLIGMMLGIALTLFDEREWGTLSRLQTGGVPVAGVLIGKVLARVVVGVAQMLVLFAVGRSLFGISLGRAPAALLLPTVAMSFAAAALGVVVPTVARAHDAVMPVGTMTSLALSAIGGCWWPLDFEPGWMRALADWLPTTWTMQAYNDLMIRRLPASVAWRPAAITAALGVVVLVAGVAALTRADA